MFTYGWTITVRSASFKQDQTQFRAYRRLVTCSTWNRASDELITGPEDWIACIFDADGWMLADLAACGFAASPAAFLPPAELCLIRTANCLSLTDDRILLLNPIAVAAGAAICVSPTSPA
jgi:hypothetical protein